MTITALPPAPSRSAPATFATLADAWVAALATFVTETNAVAVAMNLNDTTATSVTSLLIEVASKSLTVDTGKSYQPGMSVKIARTASPSNWMHGDVTSYNTGTGALVVNVTSILGSGTYTDWTITLSGPATAVNFASEAEIDTGTEAAKAIAPDQLRASEATAAEITTGTAVKLMTADQFALAARGKLVQVAYATVNTLVSGSTVIPNDNTIPQITEGFEVVTCSITPKNVNNLLVIIVSMAYGFYDSVNASVAALFQDSTANALCAVGRIMASTSVLVHKMTAGTTSATTFKLRIGPTSADTQYINTIVGNTTVGFGGVEGTSITIFEYAP